MKITIATEKKDIRASLKIAEDLKEWFTETAIENMKIDFVFNVNTLIVAKEKERVIGFLCYTKERYLLKIKWMGVARNCQRKGIGNELLRWLEKEAKKEKYKTIQVETLTDEEDYKPYELTRNFYYKRGFKKTGVKVIQEGCDTQIVLEKKIE